MHVQDFPARYAPQMGFEGANVLFDTWVHPLMMGLEEHLLGMFRQDFEFNDESAPSHLGGAKKALGVKALDDEAPGHATAHAPAHASGPELEHAGVAAGVQVQTTQALDAPLSHTSGEQNLQDWVQVWSQDAQLELKKIPFFVRGKAKRNTEKFAKETGVIHITVETLYEAKAHFSR